MKTLKKSIVLIAVMAIFSLSGYAQTNFGRRNILRFSDDVTLRQQVVDSIINESFWENEARKISQYAAHFKKEDFSEAAKQKLLSYFDRSLNENEIDEIIKHYKRLMQNDEESHKARATQQNIPFEEYYERELNILVERGVSMVQNRARRNVSIYYPRLLGWLNYQPAIPIIETVLRDSLTNENYAGSNREIFELNCKLALARMGNKYYEERCLAIYKDVEINCCNVNFYMPLNDLFYINTRNSIAQIIQYSMSEKTFMCYAPDAWIAPSPCFAKDVIILYLFFGITNYPLQFDGRDRELIMFWPEGIIALAIRSYYKEQIPKLEQWLKENAETYEINTERFY